MAKLLGIDLMRIRLKQNGGRGEIRTHGGLAPTTVFKTVALNRSATLPHNRINNWRFLRNRIIAKI